MSDFIGVEVKGLTALNAKFARLPVVLQDKLRIFIARFTISLREKVKNNILSRFHSQGPLYRGVKSEIEESPGSVTGRVYIDEVIRYAGIQERGGTVHIPEVVPVNARALAFMAPARMGLSSGGGASGMVFAMRAKAHPVTIPERSYARLALFQMRQPFERGIREVVGEARQETFAVAAE